jgi:hypothetical protein
LIENQSWKKGIRFSSVAPNRDSMKKSGSFDRNPVSYKDGLSTTFLHGESVARIEPSSICAINEGTDTLLRSIKIGKGSIKAIFKTYPKDFSSIKITKFPQT